MASAGVTQSTHDTHGSPGLLAKQLQEWVEEMAPDLGASMFADLLNAALGEVDWYEIADSYYEEEHEDDETEEEEEAK